MTIEMPKLFTVRSSITLHGFRNVPVGWFVLKRERHLFGPNGSLGVGVRDLLPNYGGNHHGYDSADALEEYLTESEAETFSDWVLTYRQTATGVEPVQFPIMLEGNTILGSIGSTAVGGETGFLTISRSPDYALPFKVEGYFDIRGCEAHRDDGVKHMPTNSNDRPAAVPITDAEAFDSSCWTHKHDDLIKRIIDQIGHPDQHLDEIARELATQIGPDAQLRASLLERYSQEYLDDCTKRRTETARQMVQSFVRRCHSDHHLGELP
jgi:hypothetical protein